MIDLFRINSAAMPAWSPAARTLVGVIILMALAPIGWSMAEVGAHLADTPMTISGGRGYGGPAFMWIASRTLMGVPLLCLGYLLALYFPHWRRRSRLVAFGKKIGSPNHLRWLLGTAGLSVVVAEAGLRLNATGAGLSGYQWAGFLHFIPAEWFSATGSNLWWGVAAMTVARGMIGAVLVGWGVVWYGSRPLYLRPARMAEPNSSPGRDEIAPTSSFGG